MPMLSITRRPLTEDERDILSRSLSDRPRLGAAERLGYLVAIPLMAAVPAYLLLLAAHLRWTWALPLALLLGVGLGVFFLGRQRRQRAALFTSGTAKLRDDLKAGAAQVWEFDVVRVWPVSELNERGPGYLFEVDQEMLVYVATRDLLLWGEGRFPTRRVAIHRLPHSKDILTIAGVGDPITPESNVIRRSELPIVGTIKSELLWRSGLGSDLQTRLWG
jgi:hypothetical protein